MKKEKTKKQQSIPVSEGEMELLKMLWEQGPSTLTEVHKNYSRTIGYTTIQTRLNRMVEKGILSRSSVYPAVYTPIVELKTATGTFFEKIAKMCSGTLAPLIAYLTRDPRRLTPEEVEMLKELIAKHEESSKFKDQSAK